ncbi:CRM-domain containing factor CFM3, chloroplastic/mitochondrial [Macadamia integrifolia]|uniref:CRM-domain containing factor CFM3, chloroplastic/mitochondrial n=1 Tax=Macadamia integrifolia TaxID=60698 RepID=UPI001C4F09C1|nr:CRM-domain containing factor CFM3, chloroplastic/mitochondrial [Macadamia integrifolia]
MDISLLSRHIFPSYFLASPPPPHSHLSFSFYNPQSRKCSLCGFRTLRLQTFCSNQTIQHETEEPENTQFTYKIKRKKRKLKPSFYEQIRDRWSQKIGSQRAKFPWQEEEDQQQQQEEEGEPEVEEKGGEPELADSMGFAFGNRSVSAPWTHGSKPRRTNSYAATEIDQSTLSGLGELTEIPEFSKKNGPSMTVTQNNGGLEEEKGSGEILGSVANVDASPIRLVEEEVDDFSEELSASNESIDVRVGSSDNRDLIRLPWERKKRSDSIDQGRWRRSHTKLAEKKVPEAELRRLKNLALGMKERIKVGAAGVTRALVDFIHEKWKKDEVVKLKFEGPPALNMKKIHDALEQSKTGGLVIWRSGSSLVLYRGMAYGLICVQSYSKQNEAIQNIACNSRDLKRVASVNVRVNGEVKTKEPSRAGLLVSSTDLSDEPMDRSDLTNLLDELGPRFSDWTGRDPQPVDADLLPGVVHGYKPPFRLLPHGIRHCLRDKEMTMFRRLARTVSPHFALGRNRQLQGLAMAMVKLWRRSAIAKIAIKRGVQNTCNERMAEELKNLTGGTLVSRNKEYIVFYRGNDFLTHSVTEALLERQKLAELQQDKEEQARQKAWHLIISNVKAARGPLVAGTLAESMAAAARWENLPSSEEMEKMMKDAALARHASLVSYLEKKMNHAQEKVRKAEKALGKVQEFLKPAELPTDLETITDEERFLFHKIGLSMKPFLLLGRRDIFDGIVENMHLHWKHRELVKLIVKGKSFAQIKHIAISLEAESGGLLISLDKTTKGYAIVIYRGKNYQRPHALRPRNLLTKRQALARSIELQRREALNHHISELHNRIEMLKSELDQMIAIKDAGDESFYSRFTDAYSSDDDDDDMEKEDEEAYLETYDAGDEDCVTENEFLSDKESMP